MGVNVNEAVAQELHKPVIKKLKKGKSMQGLNIIFRQQTSLKWEYYLLRIEVLNIYCV